LPTQGGITVQEFVDFGLALRAAREAVKGKAASPIGAHFEGPFINPQRKGAFEEEHLRGPAIDECKLYLDAVGDILKLITLSPELPNAEKVIGYLAEHGVVVSAGHTLATREQFTRAVDAGVSHVTHLFNTFLPSGWAEDGVWDVSLVETALVEPRVNCELICDLHHVHPIHLKMCGMILNPDRFVAITDSCSYGGYEPGEYRMLDGREYSTRSGAARLTTGKDKNGLIGSVLTMDRAFANLVETCHFDAVTAARFTATNRLGH
jgi:N-acetylglucosamine-6-phosphate deacetylase